MTGVVRVSLTHEMDRVTSMVKRELLSGEGIGKGRPNTAIRVAAAGDSTVLAPRPTGSSGDVYCFAYITPYTKFSYHEKVPKSGT
jgi:hypothetical protein